MTAASKARCVALVVVTVLAIANVAMIAVSPSWRHGAGGLVSLVLALALSAAGLCWHAVCEGVAADRAGSATESRDRHLPDAGAVRAGPVRF